MHILQLSEVHMNAGLFIPQTIRTIDGLIRIITTQFMLCTFSNICDIKLTIGAAKHQIIHGTNSPSMARTVHGTKSPVTIHITEAEFQYSPCINSSVALASGGYSMSNRK